MLKLSSGISFDDLYRREGLVRLDGAFVANLRTADAQLCEQLIAARLQPDVLSEKQESELLIAVAPRSEEHTSELQSH